MDEGRDGGSPASPGGPVMPKTRLPAELRFCVVGECAPVVLGSSSALVGSVVAVSSCATTAELAYICDAGGSPLVVMTEVRRRESQQTSLAWQSAS